MGESQNFIDLNKFFRKGHKCLVWVCVADEEEEEEERISWNIEPNSVRRIQKNIPANV